MELIIRNTTNQPIYDQIYSQIKAQIIAGKLSPGEALPSIRALAKDLRVSVITTQKNWEDCVKKAKKECTNAEFFDTICGATSKRQEEAVQLAAQCGVSALELMEMLRILLKEEEPHV